MASPEPTTDTERYFFGELAPLLAPDERVRASAYLAQPVRGRGVRLFVSAWKAKAAFFALTDRRIVAIETRVPARAPLLEHKGHFAIERAAIKTVTDLAPSKPMGALS